MGFRGVRRRGTASRRLRHESRGVTTGEIIARVFGADHGVFVNRHTCAYRDPDMMNSLTAERHDQVLGTGLNVVVFRMAESPACRQFQPELDDLVRRRPEIAVWTVEAMKERALSTRHHLKALPSIVIYRDGLPCRRFAGAMAADALSDAIDEVAVADMGEEHQDWMLWMAETGEAGSPYIDGQASADPGEVGTPGGLDHSASRRPDSRGQAVELDPVVPSRPGVPMTEGVGEPLAPMMPAASMRPARPMRSAMAATLATPMGAVVPAGAGFAPRRTDDPVSGRNLESLMNSATIAWYAGDAATAIRDFTTLLEMDPTSEQVLSSRGQVLADNGGGVTAVKDLDRAIAGSIDEFSAAYARSARALALAQSGRHDEADIDMAEALAVTPNSAWAHFRKARILLLRGDLAGMDSALRRAMETAEPPLTEHQRAMAQALLQLT
ncbi:thioredoxin domain-containing protein [Kineosporia sp. NBRC 101731]|uniref:thioredoxin domain-containing protein n=1 Tax=Kineosporia sp. NBRC 101731 TaxID=3032199 RepID=UPI003321E347